MLEIVAVASEQNEFFGKHILERGEAGKDVGRKGRGVVGHKKQ